MSISLLHQHGRAVVLHDGPLTWTASLELVDKLELAIESYFYTTVELVVSSPGGVTGALVYVLNSLERWREKGVLFRTRVIHAAASAAAILVCTGDDRVAEPGAVLLLHDVKAIDTGPLSARESANLHRVLQLDPLEARSCASREHPAWKKGRRAGSPRIVAKGRE